MTTQVHRNRGLVKIGKNSTVVANLPIPHLRDDYILIKTVAVALNPADWQNLDEDFEPSSTPLLVGHDGSGIIEGIGKNVTKRLQVGDRVMTIVHGINVLNPEDGSFAEHIQARGDISIRIPSHMSFTDAATMPCGLGTVALGFYKYLGIPMPPAIDHNHSWIFVYGGSSATGTLAIQIAKLSGLKVVTTCSPKNFDLVKSLGVDAVYDYRDTECADKIRSLTSNNLTRIFDTIATPTAARICADAMGSAKGGIYCSLMDIDAPRDDITSIFFLGYTALGRRFVYEGEEWPLALDDYDLMKRFAILAEELLEQGRIKAHPAAIRDGGLDAIPTGMDDMRRGLISGEKLVYLIRDEKLGASDHKGIH